MKKSGDDIVLSENNIDDNNVQLQNANIMILDYPTEDGEEEEHLELIDCGEDYINKNMVNRFSLASKSFAFMYILFASTETNYFENPDNKDQPTNRGK